MRCRHPGEDEGPGLMSLDSSALSGGVVSSKCSITHPDFDLGQLGKESLLTDALISTKPSISLGGRP